jgi:hypothetical protein
MTCKKTYKEKREVIRRKGDLRAVIVDKGALVSTVVARCVTLNGISSNG